MPSDPPITPNPFVRIFVMGLPLGILIMAALSFVLYFQKRNAALEPKSSKFADMMRRDINAEDLQRYAKILSKDIGERTPAQKDNLETAASFIESTMGFDNMGYQVQRHEFAEQGVASTDLVVDLVGEDKPREIVLVIASYSGDKDDSASSMAALMSLAHHFTGTKHSRTLRFVAQGKPVAPQPRFPNFISINTQNVKENEAAHHGVILLNGPQGQQEASSFGPAMARESLKLTLWNVDVVANPEKSVSYLREIAAKITTLLDQSASY